MKVILRVTAGPHTGMEYTFDRHETFVVGRSSQVQFPVPEDGFLSRNHFLIEFNPPVCFLRDLGSTNGTKVNGHRVETVRLRNGDQIAAGGSSFVIHVEESSGEATMVRCLGCGNAAAPEVWISAERDDRPRHLYERLGFGQLGVVQGYYQGREAALRMSRHLVKS